MLCFVGDIHGQFEVLPLILKDVPINATVIQVGDFGIWPQTKSQWKRLGCLNNPIYFICGNHEHYISLRDIREPTEIWPGAIYLPRGTVLNLEGVNIGFMGGAASIDRAFRRNGVDWFYDEAITREDFEKLYSYTGSLDLMVTHTPPNDFIQRNLDQSHLQRFGLPQGWRDQSAVAVQELWNRFERPPLVAGHLHRSLYEREGPIRVLDENEVVVWRGKEKGFERPDFGARLEIVDDRERRKTPRLPRTVS